MRLPEHPGENALSKAVAARRAAGLRILDLTESNPTRAGFAYEEEKILRAISKPEALSYEPDPRGLPAAREAVARYAGCTADDVLLTASTSEAYSLLFKLLCAPGDEVLVPEPSYPLFGYLTALESVRTRPYALRFDGEWHVDHSTVEVSERTRAILAVTPGNPTGAYLSEADRVALERRGVPLILDEVFADYSFTERPRFGEPSVLTFRLSGLSKVCGLPQLKLGWCIARGPGAAEALHRLELIADTYLSVGTPVQCGAAELLETRFAFQRQVRERTLQNLRVLRAVRAAGAPWDVLVPQAGWTAVLSVPRTRTEEEWALALLDAGILVHPGYFFDFPSGAHLVVSLLPRAEEFAEAALILARTLAQG